MPLKPEAPPPGTNPGAQFTTTHWSVVLTAGHGSSPDARQALERLCRTYWYPLYAYVRRRGVGIDNAEDLTQEFFLRLLQGKRLALADPARGRFRTFLLSALQNFLANEWTKASREKRGGKIEFVPLVLEDAEKIYAAERADESTPEALYERRWAATVMQEAMNQLRAEYTGREKLFAILQASVWGETGSQPLAELAAALGMTEGAVRVAVHRLRSRYRERLRETIAQTVSNAAEVDAELRHLIQVVSRNAL
jgi:RNA polymerase sigma factor (sigma-70 family)